MNIAGATVPVQSIKACVVYDAASGRIHHQHRVLTLVGGYEPAKSEIAARALHAVKNRREPPTGDLEVLHVDHQALERGKHYRVEIHTRRLVAD